MTRTFIGAEETLNPTGGVTRAIKEPSATRFQIMENMSQGECWEM